MLDEDFTGDPSETWNAAVIGADAVADRTIGAFGLGAVSALYRLADGAQARLRQARQETVRAEAEHAVYLAAADTLADAALEASPQSGRQRS